MKRNEEYDSDTETPRKRARLMGPADGFSKPRAKPPSKNSAPQFTSAFDATHARTKPSSKSSGVQLAKALTSRFVDSAVRIPEPKETREFKQPMRALKPPVPLFNSVSKPPAIAKPPPPPPTVPIFPQPISKNAALRQLAPPAPPAPTASSSKLTAPLKPLVPPTLPALATPSSDRTLRTISTTLLARATDLFTENGASELASIFLHDQHPGTQFPSSDDVDERRGVMMSPEKGGKGKEKYVRNGLAARAAALYDRSHASLSLWEAEMAHTLSSSRRSLNPDMRLRILHILHIPAPVSHPSSKLSTPGVALCHLLTAPASESSDSLVFPKSKDSIYAVLLSFSSLSPPPRPQAQMQLDIRNPEDFIEGREVHVWKPWQVVAIDTSALRLCLESEDDTDLTREADAEVFEFFESGAARVRHRDSVSETALVCERFVILK